MQPSHEKTSHFPLKWVFSEQDGALAPGRACVSYNSSYRRASTSKHCSATAPTRFTSPQSTVSPGAEEGWQQGSGISPASLPAGGSRCKHHVPNVPFPPWEKSIAAPGCSPAAVLLGLGGPRAVSVAPAPEEGASGNISPSPSEGPRGLTCQEQT